MSKIYAKVIDNQIKEYPVCDEYILNRNHNVSDYTECVFNTKPSINNFEYLEEDVSYNLIFNKVFINYNIKEYDLQTVLKIISNKNKLPNIFPNEQSNVVTIADLNRDEIDKIYNLTSEYITKLLDQFAQTKGYDNIITVTTYINSSVIEYKNEANRAVLLRDQTWASSSLYFDKVLKGEIPLPKTIEDITSQLPVLTW